MSRADVLFLAWYAWAYISVLVLWDVIVTPLVRYVRGR